MIDKKIVLTAKDGFHARPASMFAKMAMGFSGEVKLQFEGREVNGKSIMSILTLGATCGAEVTLICHGDGEELISQQLSEFMETME